jgi:DNA-binding beta-propeller fold protein YncE
VVNRLDNTVSILTINATNGTLTLVDSVATGSEPFRIAIDLSGQFASYNLKSNGTLTAAGTAATQGAALSVVLRWNQLGDGQSDTKPYGTSLKLNLAPNLTGWRKLLHLCCTSLW